MAVLICIIFVKIKPEYQEETCMFVLYVVNHPVGSHHMFDMDIKITFLGCDSKWIKKMHG